MTKPIRVWLTVPGPNGWKVVLILEELNVPYELVPVKFENVKKSPMIDLNPNGRSPAIEDPNHDLVLWESGAIIQYLIEVYDTDKKLTYDSFAERHKLNQWLHFQMSGQGPYYGISSWFNHLHHEKLPSAIERGNEQLRRVLQVLEDWLKETENQCLVGNKITFADLSFVPWNDRVNDVMLLPPDQDKFQGYPHVKVWHERMTARPTWMRIMEKRAELMESE